MHFLYNLAIHLTRLFIPFLGLFSPKMRLFYKGRKKIFLKIESALSNEDKSIWMHCASLGEFEQGRPLIEKIKKQFPDYKLVLSFFSPSGYEVRKDYDFADVVVYLPLDTPKNAMLFIEKVHPTLAIFIKYEFWPNILVELRKQKVPTLLVSGIFRKDQMFFKDKKKWIRDFLETFTHFFVQNKESLKLLKSIGFDNVTLSGDTRFDRVSDLVKNKKELPLIQSFTEKHHTLVAGSTWEKDEKLLVDYINNVASAQERFILAPHNIKAQEIEKLKQKLAKETLLYSQANLENTQKASVLIIDSIGLLTSVYAYAQIAYVGGGFGTGIHNILEPATYGIPILIGPKYQKFQEAKDLISQKACFEIQNQEDLNNHLQEFFSDKEKEKKASQIALQYVQDNIGATDSVMEYLKVVL